MKIKLIHEKCDLDVSNTKDLPCTAYVVEYSENGKVYHDIAIANKRVDIFDHYWDTYREGFITMYQSEGRTNPKLWGNAPKKKRGKNQ